MSANAHLALAVADSRELEDLFDSIALAPPAKSQPEGDDLEALFDSIALAARAPAPAPASEADELEALFDSVAAERAQAAAPGVTAPEAHDGSTCRVINSVGQLTRQLHDTLAELGYDRQLQECTAAMLPDARQRLAYVVTLTEQAASRSLNAVEAATPVQESLAADASTLSGRWDALFRGEADVEQFKTLAKATREYLASVPGRTETTREQLREVMMAQEFQDLTGQVLKRITDLANNLEAQLLKLLVEHAPAPVNKSEALGLLNGPAIAGSADVVTSQAQVDELLESLGF